jgi:antitoxin ParD1/3/4
MAPDIAPHHARKRAGGGAHPGYDLAFSRQTIWSRFGPFPLSQQRHLVVQNDMSITLTPEQEAWLKAHVVNGDFASIEEAARQLIDDRISEIAADDNDDMAWAKPLVDEARAAIARGEVMTLEEHRVRNAERLAALRDE